MKVYLYTVRDKIAHAYGNIFQAPNDMHAMRTFRLEVNRPHENNVVYHNTDDFTLYSLGEYDTENGQITPHESPVLVCTANKLVKEK
ncbi:MAG: nonstructural protein [Microviridae sp.]|nr:MAG: nonstructural protein [Microviridae sp.]